MSGLKGWMVGISDGGGWYGWMDGWMDGYGCLFERYEV